MILIEYFIHSNYDQVVLCENDKSKHVLTKVNGTLQFIITYKPNDKRTILDMEIIIEEIDKLLIQECSDTIYFLRDMKLGELIAD